MTLINRNDVLNLYCRFIKDKTKDDVCWFFKNKPDADHDYGLVGVDITKLNGMMKEWRERAKKGELFINKDDSGSATTFDGIEWHYLVLNNPPEVYKHEIDPFGYFLFNMMMDGEMLFFKHKSNRDKVQEYVMRRLEK